MHLQPVAASLKPEVSPSETPYFSLRLLLTSNSQLPTSNFDVRSSLHSLSKTLEIFLLLMMKVKFAGKCCFIAPASCEYEAALGRSFLAQDSSRSSLAVYRVAAAS